MEADAAVGDRARCGRRPRAPDRPRRRARSPRASRGSAQPRASRRARRSRPGASTAPAIGGCARLHEHDAAIDEDRPRRRRRPDDRDTREARIWIASTGARLALALRSQPAVTPSRSRRRPAAAIIAALSVVSARLGTNTGMPARSPRAMASARSRLLADTPPAIPMLRAPNQPATSNVRSSSAWNDGALKAGADVGNLGIRERPAVSAPSRSGGPRSSAR